MYIRVNPSSIVLQRVGKKFSRLPAFLVIMLVSLTFLLLLAIISPDEAIARVSPESNPNYRRDELATWRSNQSVLAEDYIDINDPQSFLLQPTIPEGGLSPYCGPSVNMLIMVASAPRKFSERKVIRETWGNKTVLEAKGGRILFVFGRTDNNSIDSRLAEESAKYDDIIVEDFLDTYHNLTLKSVAMLKWINLTCSVGNASMYPKYVLKTDDDVFINYDRLVKVTQDMPNARMIGRLTCGAVPIGDASSKLYMPKYLFAGRVYPGYLSGTAYVLKTEIIPTLLRNTYSISLIHLEDVYVTALLARRSRIYPDDSPFFTYNRLDPKDECALRFMVNSHQMKPNEMRSIHNMLQGPPTKICNPKKAKWLRKAVKVNRRIKVLCQFS